MFNAGLLREPTLPFYPLQVGANIDSLHADGVSVFLFFWSWLSSIQGLAHNLPKLVTQGEH